MSTAGLTPPVFSSRKGLPSGGGREEYINMKVILPSSLLTSRSCRDKKRKRREREDGSSIVKLLVPLADLLNIR